MNENYDNLLCQLECIHVDGKTIKNEDEWSHNTTLDIGIYLLQMITLSIFLMQFYLLYCILKFIFHKYFWPYPCTNLNY
jgi:hypothetical protein